MVTKRSSFFDSALYVTLPRERFDSDTAFSVSMLLRNHAGAQKAHLRACTIVPSQALIPNRRRQTGSVMLSLHFRHCFRRHFPKPVLTTKCQWWDEITNAITVYLCKDMVTFQIIDRKGFKEMVKTLYPRHALPARTHFSQIEMLLRQCPKASGEQIHTIKHQRFSEMGVA